jgi:hypothetical protein
VFFLLDLIPQLDLMLFHQYYAQEQGLNRFLETQHGGHEGIQRSRNPSPTHEVRTQKNYWNEFVFLAYHLHQADAISLSGIPDLEFTLLYA